MKIREVYPLFRDPGGKGPVTALQDSFGSQFRRLRYIHTEGEIVSVKLICKDQSPRATAKDSSAEMKFSIIRRVHPDTVYALLRRAGLSTLRLDAGYWYEVHGD